MIITAERRATPVPPSPFPCQQVLSVHHWNDRLFSFRVTRDPGFRFRNGQFVMVGLPATEVESKPVMRAYSIASPNYEEHLEFFSIKIDDGALTSRLQHLHEGDHVLLSTKPVGTLVLDDIKPGKRLFLLATGTGLAPYLSTVRDLETYDRFEQVILVHCVRRCVDLAYRELLTRELQQDPYLGEMAREQLRYLPVVTREPFVLGQRIPELIASGTLTRHLGLGPLDRAKDRAMLCGSLPMLRDTQAALEALGFEISPNQGLAGDFVIERAFVG
ncbi:MAG: ferredoxin--NADP reductase [Deinococcota bacterium]